MLIYLDSVVVIYAIDGSPPLEARALGRLALLHSAGDQIAVSDLTRLECRVKPLRTGDATGLAQFDSFFADPDFVLVPMTTAVFDRATDIRAQYNFKLADSLHLAAAVEGGCDLFLTNDLRLNSFPDLAVEILP